MHGNDTMQYTPWARLAVFLLGLLSITAAPVAQAQEEARQRVVTPPKPPTVVIDAVEGEIDGDQLAVEVTLSVTTHVPGQSIDLLGGDAVLRSLATESGEVIVGDDAGLGERSATVGYDIDAKQYTLTLAAAGTVRLEMALAVRAYQADHGGWYHASWTLPVVDRRPIRVTSAQAQLEVALPGAVQVEREVAGEGDDAQLTVTGLQGLAEELVVLWRETVGDLRAELVLSSEANTLVSVRDGGLRVDTVFAFGIAQGELDALTLTVPEGLNVTQVRGASIQDWTVVEPDTEDGERILQVTLRLPQTGGYALQVVGEMELAAFPTRAEVPVVAPPAGIRASGHVSIGTASAIALVVERSAGLTQIDASAMPRVSPPSGAARALPGEGPGGKAFYYSYATTPYAATLSLDRVVPAIDAEHRVVVDAREDGLVYETQVGLEVRDAPVRGVGLTLPDGFTVLRVSGEGVSDFQVQPGAGDAPAVLRVQFGRPMIGQVALAVVLESGEPPLGVERAVGGLSLIGASSERGHVVVSVAEGLTAEVEVGDSLRQVNTGSTPFTVARAQSAYRFRDSAWSLRLIAQQRPAMIRAEAFQLVSIGEGVAYGNVAINYFITGSPVDELWVRVDPRVENVQFFGRDVRRFDVDEDDPSLWRVELQRRVIDDYNLGVGYHQRYVDGGEVLIGGVSAADAQTQSAYVAVASPLDLELDDTVGLPARTLLPLTHEELPANYRLLITAPLLRAYKAVGPSDPAGLVVDAYDRGELTPVIIELAQVHTQVAPGTASGGAAAGSDAESTTRIRYRIKNARSQFLRLQMPAGATGWSVHLIGTDAFGEETRQRLTVSTDPADGRLMVPLPRPLDPNSPMTIELAYGQVHAGASRDITLEAPVSDVASTYEVWTVQAPEDWALRLGAGSGATMRPEPRAIERGRLAGVLGEVGKGWRKAFNRKARSGRLAFAVLAGAALVLLVFLLYRPAAGFVSVGVLLAIAVWIGSYAGGYRGIHPGLSVAEPLDTMTWTRVIDQGGDQGAVVAVELVEERSFYISMRSLVTYGALSVALLLVGLLWRPGRAVLMALGLAGLVYTAGRWPPLAEPLGHALTWGLPALLLVLWVVSAALRLAKLRPGVPVGSAVAAAMLALATLGSAGCAQTGGVVAPPPPVADTMLDHVSCDLTASDDAMRVDYAILFSTDKPVRFELIGDGAILQPGAAVSSDTVRIERGDRGYVIVATEPGRYDVAVQFLVPLNPADAQRARAFRLALPSALSNTVRATLPGTGLDIAVDRAILSQTEEQGDATVVTATLGPTDDLSLRWRPRDRRRDLEATQFYATSRSLVWLAAGSAQALHDITLEVAQGQVTEIELTLPDNMTATQVSGEALGAWRFDPETHRLEAKLTRPVTAGYRLLLTTQTPVDALPYTLEAGVPRVVGAARQHATLGLGTAPSVYATVDDAPASMNEQDFGRDAAVLLRYAQGRASVPPEVRFACRLEADQRVRATVREVLPEIRSAESAGFTIEEERLVYTSEFVVAVSKAGVFSTRLRLPEGYDIDALSANGATHWDEETGEDGERYVRLHYATRVTGNLPVQARLSRAITQPPASIQVPRIEAVGSLKHTGQVVIAAAQGLRLSIDQRDGISEVNPLELGIRTPGVLAANTLRPDWSVRLAVEQVQPRITADTLHVAAVSDGAVRHTVYLRYTLQHAGAKVFRVRLPADALGVRLVGPGVARRTEVEGDPGVWEVELSSKWFDRPYPLAVQYDTAYAPDAESVQIDPVVAVGTDLQRGYLTVLSAGRVEVAAAAQAGGMVRADPRALPASFGAGDLSEAALCYRCPSAGYGLSLAVSRFDNAQQDQATVLNTQIATVLTADGESINRVQVELRVGGKRYLETRLPDGGRLLALRVNGRAAEPSTRTDSTTNETVYLVPLESAVMQDAHVQVDLVYAHRPSVLTKLASPLALQGPRFDLPLRDVRWTVYAPDGYEYERFAGNAIYHEPDGGEPPVVRFTPEDYDAVALEQQRARLLAAQQFQHDASVLADRGDPRAARAALEQAMYFSLGDRALNEDARVQLHRLSTDQAVAGLIGSRSRLRELDGGRVPLPTANGAGDERVLNLSRRDLQQVRAALSRPDGENLALIAARFMTTQHVAGARPVPLVVEMPLRGQVLEFSRPVQAQPNAALEVSFRATPKPDATGRAADYSPWIVAGVLLVLLVPAQWIAARRRRAASAA